MKYLVDAQLPKSLSRLLTRLGYNSIHTIDLPDGNNTKDWELNERSLAEQRIIISKDSDFIESMLISSKPFKLLHISVGNINNQDLLSIFAENIDQIDKLFLSARLIEVNDETIIVHQ